MTILKIDIEGYEEKALRSVEKLLGSSIDLDVVVEIMINDYNKQEVFDFMKDCGFDSYLITNAGLISEDRPLVMPQPNVDPRSGKLRTQWKNHFFTKRPQDEIQNLNLKAFGYCV